MWRLLSLAVLYLQLVLAVKTGWGRQAGEAILRRSTRMSHHSWEIRAIPFLPTSGFSIAATIRMERLHR